MILSKLHGKALLEARYNICTKHVNHGKVFSIIFRPLSFRAASHIELTKVALPYVILLLSVHKHMSNIKQYDKLFSVLRNIVKLPYLS